MASGLPSILAANTGHFDLIARSVTGISTPGPDPGPDNLKTWRKEGTAASICAFVSLANRFYPELGDSSSRYKD